MSFIALPALPAGEELAAAPLLAAHPEHSYLKPILKDMESGPWMAFGVGEPKMTSSRIGCPTLSKLHMVTATLLRAASVTIARMESTTRSGWSR